MKTSEEIKIAPKIGNDYCLNCHKHLLGQFVRLTRQNPEDKPELEDEYIFCSMRCFKEFKERV